jgi:hypothetical protein
MKRQISKVLKHLAEVLPDQGPDLKINNIMHLNAAEEYLKHLRVMLNEKNNRRQEYLKTKISAIKELEEIQ